MALKTHDRNMLDLLTKLIKLLLVGGDICVNIDRYTTTGWIPQKRR